MCTGFEIMAVASAAQGIGGMLSGNDEAKQYKTRAGQVLQSGMQEIDQAAYEMDRYRGSQKAAYGKAGVKMKGSAARTLEEQLYQDEKTLLTAKYNTMMGVKDNLNAYKSKKMEGVNALISGGFKAAGYGMM
jgi:hypothetical protein